MMYSPFTALLPIADLASSQPKQFYKARRDFADLISRGCYQNTGQQGFYVLEITGPLGKISYGICGMINTEDYGGETGAIRPHEATLKAKEAIQTDRFLQSNYFIKPILLTCPGYDSLQDYLKKICQAESPTVTFNSKEGDHIRLFVLANHEDIRQCEQLLAELPAPVAVADGHHRISTAKQLAGFKTKYGKRFAKIPAVLIPVNSLVIDSFVCSITAPEAETANVLGNLEQYFHIAPTKRFERPTEKGHWLLSHGEQVYQLHAKQDDDRPGTAWFDQHVLPAVFGITDSSHDPRWSATPADQDVNVIVKLTQKERLSWHFLPPPVDMDSFFHYLEEGKILPPKSTRFLPRIPSGLIVKVWAVD